MPVALQQDIEDTIGVIKLVAQPGSLKESYNDNSGTINCEKEANKLKKELNSRIKINGLKTDEIINHRINKLEARLFKLED